MDKRFTNILVVEVLVAGLLTLLGFLPSYANPCQGMTCYVPGGGALVWFFAIVGSWILVVMTLAVGSTRSLTQKRGNPLVGIGVLIAILLFGFFLIWKVQQ